jgi:phosphoenolpyruvate phosphomutase / 2-hydroxyethylphosphonate cytidylyltransferase
MKKSKNIYLSLSADIIHSGHINIIKKAKKYGNIIVGLLTDKAIGEYRPFPLINFEQRYKIIKNINFVSKIVKQDEWDDTFNLKKLKPDFVIHGDDWKKGPQKNLRQKVIKTIKKWKGKLIEVPYTKKISSSSIHEKIKNIYFNSNSRVSILKRLIDSKKIVRVLESHSALTGLIIENLKIEKGDKIETFDAMWSSSLTDSTLRGKPDNQSVDYSTRISGLNEIMDVTTKPVIFDGDNGGRVEHIKFLVRSLERAGVSALVLEDKSGLKKNSLYKNQSGVKQESIKKFSKKIQVASSSKISDDFYVIARIESFILGKDLKDAINRAESYVKSGADAILIHSKEKRPKEIFDFSKKFLKSKYYRPIIAVPSTYSKTFEKDLAKNGIKVVIYANHLLRSSYPSMVNTAKSILKDQRTFKIEKNLTPITQILDLIK